MDVAREDADRQVLLITGGAGRIATMLRPRLRRTDRRLRLLDITPIADAGPDEEVVAASLTDASAVVDACTGVDAVIHLGALSNEAPWPDILAVNIDGTLNVLEGARRAGVDRLILASSNHAAGFHARGHHPLPANVVGRPDTYYGASKVALEALGSLYSDRFGMSVACLRIGTCFDEPSELRALATWLSPDDAARLVEACLAAAPFGFRVLWGISANTRRWWSLAEGEELGYFPVDDAERFAPRLIEEYGEPDLEAIDHRLVGGPFCVQPLGEWVH
jgi:uronate dehydrogenase